jgi:hypothetical protein
MAEGAAAVLPTIEGMLTRPNPAESWMKILAPWAWTRSVMSLAVFMKFKGFSVGQGMEGRAHFSISFSTMVTPGMIRPAPPRALST